MSTRANQHSIAGLFLDAENHPHLKIAALLNQLGQFGIPERHAYADWRNWRLDNLAEQLEHENFEMHYSRSGRFPGARKNIADGCMARGILRTLADHPEIQVIIIVSGDEFFTGVIKRLQREGKRVIVAADPCRASKKLCQQADQYIPLGEVGYWLHALYRLGQTSKYLTFHFAVQQLGIEPAKLSALIQKQLLIQEPVLRSQRGLRPEIRLNPKAHAVQAVLCAQI